MTHDVIRELGPLAFASHLKRLSERLMHDVSGMYADVDADFEARWFALTYLLQRQSPLAVSEAAELLGYTHPAVVQIAGAMERRGLIRSRRDARDGRRRLLSLTPRGRATVKRLAPVWAAVRACTQEVLDASGHDVLAALESVERELDREAMSSRLRRVLSPAEDSLVIEEFTPSLATHFARLNREWLGRLLPLEPRDRTLLACPEQEIIAKGGQILFARYGHQIVGTAAIIVQSSGVYEIAKMAVTAKRRGQGIGRRLCLAAIDWARARHAGEIRIATSPKLRAALALYRSLGFVEVAPDPVWKATYRRRTIFLKLAPITAPSSIQEE